jgi:hypothetical protein
MTGLIGKMPWLAAVASSGFGRRTAAGLLFSLGASAAALAEAGPDCRAAYKAMLSAIEQRTPSLSAEAQLARQRLALRLYDACQTGHLEHPGELFEKLDRSRY